MTMLYEVAPLSNVQSVNIPRSLVHILQPGLDYANLLVPWTTKIGTKPGMNQIVAGCVRNLVWRTPLPLWERIVLEYAKSKLDRVAFHIDGCDVLRMNKGLVNRIRDAIPKRNKYMLSPAGFLSATMFHILFEEPLRGDAYKTLCNLRPKARSHKENLDVTVSRWGASPPPAEHTPDIEPGGVEPAGEVEGDVLLRPDGYGRSGVPEGRGPVGPQDVPG